MRRAFLTIGERQLHLRTAGEGPPVVMLHPSPLSSAAVLPMANELAKHFRVYALDTPGYGLSDLPPRRPESLHDYLPDFAAALDALGLGRVCLYGAATGAQFAVEFAQRYPDRCALVVLDSAGHIGADECAQTVPHYFPDVKPRFDGAHLATTWHMVRELSVFFPWCDARAARRVERDLPPAALMHSMAIEYLRAGEHYDWAYRPAFFNENVDRARRVTVPAVVMRWEASVVLRITDDLIDAGLPPNYDVLRLGPTLADRTGGLLEYLRRHYREPAPTTSPRHAPQPSRLASRLLEIGGAQLHLRWREGGGGLPRVVLPSLTQSARVLEPALAGENSPGPLAVLDPDGCGESDPQLPASASLADHANRLASAIDALGFDAFELTGHGAGAGLAVELALQRPGRVRRLHLAGDPPPDAATRAALSAGENRDFTPRADGTHLLAAWYQLRDRRLWLPGRHGLRQGIRPGEPRLDPADIQRELFELARLGARYAPAREAELNQPFEARLAEVSCPVDREP